MAYSDQKYYARVPVEVATALDLGTATASGANTVSVSQTEIPPFFRRTKITGLKARVTTIPNAASTAWNVVVLNGTNTAGTIDITGGTAGQWISGSVTAANATFDANATPSLQVEGTATASGASAGDVDLVFEVQEQFE